jgi:hypothetical protein
MVSIPSALVLFVLALVGAMSPSASTKRAITAAAPARHEIRATDATPDAGWQQAVRTDAVRGARYATGRRDDSTDRHERSTSAGPAWMPLALTAAHASRTAGLARRERVSAVGAPGLPAPSSRAPPLV